MTEIDYLDFPVPPACTCLCHRGTYAPVVAIVRVHKGDTTRVLDRCHPCTESAREVEICGITVTIEPIGGGNG